MTELDALIMTGHPPLNIDRMARAGTALGPLLVLPSLQNRKSINFSAPILGAICIASYLDSKGLRVEVYDIYHDKEPIPEAPIIGISSIFLALDDLQEIASKVRAEHPDSFLVLGGPLSWSYSPEVLMGQVPQLDAVVVKEGEETFFSLIKALKADARLDKISGLFYRENGEITATADRRQLVLDDLPIPDWKHLTLEKRLKIFPIESSRGCLYNCAFCSEVHFWGKPVRFYSAEKVVKEIILNFDKFGVKTYRFTDSCFTAPVERCRTLCNEIYAKCVARGRSVKWTAYARIDNLTPDLLETMHRAGCVALDVGWESGDPKMLQNMRKRYDPETIVDIIGKAKEIGVHLHCNVLIGFPGETEKTIEKTMQVLIKGAPDTYTCFQLFIAPNTYIFQNAEKYGLKGLGLNWRHDTMTSEQAGRAVEQIYREIDTVNLFPGGEYMACYLTSLDYGYDDINAFFSAANRISKGGQKASDKALIRQVDSELSPYW